MVCRGRSIIRSQIEFEVEVEGVCGNGYLDVGVGGAVVEVDVLPREAREAHLDRIQHLIPSIHPGFRDHGPSPPPHSVLHHFHHTARTARVLPQEGEEEKTRGG